MSAFKRLFILLICCIIFTRNYGIELGNNVPYRSSSSLDESKFEKKVLHMYPENSLYHGRFETTRLLPNEFQRKLLSRGNEDSASNLSSSKSKTLQMQQGQHLVRVESKKVSASLESAPTGGGYDIFINPKYSHIIEIIRRRENPDKQNKLSNVKDSSVEKQALELTKNADLNKVSVTNATANSINYVDFDHNEFGDGDPEEFSGDEGDSIEFGDVDEGDPEDFSDVDEGDPEDFSDVDEGDPEDFSDVDEGDPEDFSDVDEGDPEDFSDVDEGDPEDFGDVDEGDPEDFGDVDEGDPEDFGDVDEGDPEDFGDVDEGDPEDFGDVDEGDPEDFGDVDEGDPEDFGDVDEGDPEDFGDVDEGDPEDFGDVDEGDPEDFGDVDEGDPEDFGDVDEGDPEDFGDVDEGDPEDFGDVDEGDPEDFGDVDEGDPEDFGDVDEGDPEDFGDVDEGDPEDFGDVDEGDTEDFGDADEGDTEDFGDADEGDPEEFGDADEGDPGETSYEGVKVPENGDADDLPLDEMENKLIDEANIIKPTVTANDNIAGNKESAFNEEFEGSGEELSDISDRNTTKSGRILGMFSRQNETFPNCTTPKGEAGHCRRLGECLLSEVLNNFNGFLQQLCLIRGALVGICCPDNPVIEIVNPEENVTSELTSEELKQPPEGCGLNTKTRIVGGSISVPHEWTWMVALMRRNRFYCGGVIINNWYILTAAHCVMGMNVKDLTVRLGEYDFNEQSKHTEDLSVAEIKRHAQFVTLTFQHDIALLKLKRSIKYSKFVGSICLPEQKGRDYTDVKGTVVGWGTVSFGGAASPILRQVTIPVWKNEDCDRTYLLERIGESFLCAGAPEKGEDACQGDSGGPLMTLNENSRWEVIGLVSWGRRCGDPTYPGVYTRVTTYLDWIKQNAV